jgi:hypothetical protein
MDHEFDVFETFPDSSVEWRGCVRGTTLAHAKLAGLSRQTANTCFAIDLVTRAIIRRADDVQQSGKQFSPTLAQDRRVARFS